MMDMHCRTTSAHGTSMSCEHSCAFGLFEKDAAFAVSFFAALDIFAMVRIIIVRLCLCVIPVWQPRAESPLFPAVSF